MRLCLRVHLLEEEHGRLHIAGDAAKHDGVPRTLISHIFIVKGCPDVRSEDIPIKR
jgi:hypothetical protein